VFVAKNFSLCSGMTAPPLPTPGLLQVDAGEQQRQLGG
jgi:hypothetical protein